jgi:predicted short-subunit dehydrogenase-like oxidoreductase (DUF2520 family)
VNARRQRIAIVGLGRLGTCLARALLGARLGPLTVSSADTESVHRLVEELGDPIEPVSSARSLLEHADLVFLTVPDASIREVCEGLLLDQRHAIVHTSGALDTDVLESARVRGARVGVFHPLQTFPLAAASTRFRGIQIGVEGDADLPEQLTAVAQRLGAETFSLRGVDRAAYHAAAVFTSNYVVALHAAASAAWQRAGLPEGTARAALLPLTRGAVESIAEHDLPEALTGPLLRGDLGTLERHLHALAHDPEIAKLYRALALQLLRLPLPLDAETRERLARLLDAEPP